MAQPVKKVHCINPEHQDDTPSLGVYPDGSAYCYGCNAYYRGFEAPIDIKLKPPEDIEVSMHYIKRLPRIDHRGLNFPTDSKGYYIVWPDNNYYKLRRWDTDPSKSRYISPSGHKKPWFSLFNGYKRAILVEGEINALSLFACEVPWDIHCPGSASNFSDSTAVYSLPMLSRYESILLLADDDEAGLKAVHSLNKLLAGKVLDLAFKLMPTDCNDVLVNYGKEALRKEIKDMEL